MTPLPPRPDRRENRWVLYFALFVILLTSIPYIIAFISAGEDWVFTGFMFGVEDGNSYLAKMLRGWSGDWFFITPYTSMEQSGTLALLPYIWLGKLTTTANQHTQLIALFHLFRIVGIFIAVLASYDFFALFLTRISLRRWGLALSVFGGGLGWLLAMLGLGDLFGTLPLDFYSPESFGFFMYYGLPHLMIARALLLWGLVKFLRQPLSSGWFDRTGLEIGLLWFVLAFFMQPLTAVVGGAVIVVYLLALLIWRGLSRADWLGYLRRAIWAGIPPFAVVLYLYIGFASDPFLKLWTTQNTLPSPHPLHYLFAYGALLPFAYFGLRHLWKQNQQLALFLLGWLCLFPILVYAPLSFQRRAAEGVFLVWLSLALLSFEREASPKWLRPIYLSPLFLTALFFILGGSMAALNPAYPIFRPTDEITALTTFRAEIEPDAIVIASNQTGNLLPAFIPARVIIGHGPESIGWQTLEPRVASIFDPATQDATRLALFKQVGADYLYWGPLERELGDWQPGDADYLELVAEEGQYALFRILGD